MRTLLLITICLIAGCSSEDPSTTGDDNVDPNPAVDASSSPDAMGADSSAPNGAVRDQGSVDIATPDVSVPNAQTPDASMPDAVVADMLPTACTNDCLCTNGCDHRCRIECQAECAAGTCNFELNAGGRVTCRAGSTCSVSCESGGCEIFCEPGATCEVTCNPQSVYCDFMQCGGTRTECSGRRKTCDIAC